MSTGNNAPRSGLDRTQKELQQAIRSKPYFVDHVDYGIITSVDYSAMQVQIRLLGEEQIQQKDGTMGLGFWPLLTRADEIANKYGQLKAGFVVKVTWRGKEKANFAFAEIVAENQTQLFVQQEKVNDTPLLPWKMLSGGIF